jgi:fido (protein-threonine AMPylation protein)
LQVAKSRREVIQHAQALKYLLERIVAKQEPWSEALILDTHRILHTGLGEDVNAGRYRSYEDAVWYEKPRPGRGRAPRSIRAAAVPWHMRRMVERLNRDMADAERSGKVDACALAARYHHQFVNIHPFGDGNGRMSRIILNALLLRFSGCVSVVGIDAPERDEYIAIAKRAASGFHAEDMEVAFEKHTGHLELAGFLSARAEQVMKSSNDRLFPA